MPSTVEPELGNASGGMSYTTRKDARIFRIPVSSLLSRWRRMLFMRRFFAEVSFASLNGSHFRATKSRRFFYVIGVIFSR